ncbi:DNA excision repair protein ERCC-1-like [Scyliorhinus torazame]|uniref:DNA excision repair protein ERCC-1-like n=1 Tax=Scyliorhinus torazame TaxID=75743 RepID=UPI003B5AD2FA
MDEDRAPPKKFILPLLQPSIPSLDHSHFLFFTPPPPVSPTGPTPLQVQGDGGRRRTRSLSRRPGGGSRNAGAGSGEEGASGGPVVVAKRATAKQNAIVVSVRQRGNPILKFIRNVPWEFGEVVPDYILGQTVCALYLSLRYHCLNRDYIHQRLKDLGQAFALRLLLVCVDVKDPHQDLKDLAKISLLADVTLILAWSSEEAGRYLETYKSYENKPSDMLKERVETDYLSKVTECVTTVKSVNKTDSMTLIGSFKSVKRLVEASREDLSLCPGLGPQKARRLFDVFHEPFLRVPRPEPGS